MLTQDEIRKAAGGTLLEAAECSHEHWAKDICGTSAEELLGRLKGTQSLYGLSSCALCVRSRKVVDASVAGANCTDCAFKQFDAGCALHDAKGVFKSARNALQRFAKGDVSYNRCIAACKPMADQLARFVEHLKAKEQAEKCEKAKAAEPLPWWERVKIPAKSGRKVRWCVRPDSWNSGHLVCIGYRTYLVMQGDVPHYAAFFGAADAPFVRCGDGVNPLRFFTPAEARALFPGNDITDVEVLP